VHRPAAPGAITDDMNKARRLLAKNPEAGIEAEDQDLAGLRRLLMKRSEYWLYYQVDHSAQKIAIVTVWHASRLTPNV